MSGDLGHRELLAALNINSYQLTQWKENAPPDDPFPQRQDKNRFVYSPAEVAEWLIRNGKAVRQEPPKTGPVFTKVQEVAVYFKVSVKTVSVWMEDPSFPGRPGKRGQRGAGHFPAIPIARWLQNTGKKAPIPPGLLEAAQIDAEAAGGESETRALPRDARDRLTTLRADKAEIELHKLQGQMIDAEEALRHYQRSHSYTVTTLRSLPSRIQAGLPSDVDDRTRAAIDKVCKEVVQNCREMIAELIEGDKDEQE